MTHPGTSPRPWSYDVARDVRNAADRFWIEDVNGMVVLDGVETSGRFKVADIAHIVECVNNVWNQTRAGHPSAPCLEFLDMIEHEDGQ